MFLPVTMEEMKERGWQQADFVLVTGARQTNMHLGAKQETGLTERS